MIKLVKKLVDIDYNQVSSNLLEEDISTTEEKLSKRNNDYIDHIKQLEKEAYNGFDEFVKKNYPNEI